jgi:hypothetical protein
VGASASVVLEAPSGWTPDSGASGFDWSAFGAGLSSGTCAAACVGSIGASPGDFEPAAAVSFSCEASPVVLLSTSTGSLDVSVFIFGSESGAFSVLASPGAAVDSTGGTGFVGSAVAAEPSGIVDFSGAEVACVGSDAVVALSVSCS